MKKFLFAALAAIAGIASVSNAALMDFHQIAAVGEDSKVRIVNSAENDIDIRGIVSDSGYVIIGNEVTGINPADTLTYGITVSNYDDDTFDFTLLAYTAGGTLASDTANLGTDGTATLSIDVTGASDYNFGVKVSGKDDAFIYVNLSDLTVVPEPMTMSTLALGGLAFLRKRRV